MRGPGGFAGGKIVDGMVSQIDLYPTLCELLDIDPPSWLQGRSMLPLVRGEAAETNEEIFAEVTYHAAYEPMRCVRTKRWKYIRRFDGRSAGVMPNCDDGLAKRELLGHGYRDLPVAGEQLYDLVFDPNEAGNLAASAVHGEILGQLRERLRRWMERTDDPLLRGEVPLPEAGVTTGVDELDPGGAMFNHKGQRVNRDGQVLV
jgi:N-sulfoglucosamine sulfohydrolase